MLPVLLDLKFIKIYTFGVFLVLAFFWGSFLLWKLIQLTANKEEEVFDGMFISLVGGLMIGRLVYVVANFTDFGFDLIKVILVNGYPGFSLYGSLFGGGVFLFIYTKIKKIKFNELVDYFIPATFLALAFGKIGSFFSGAEIGTKTRFILAVKYANFDGLRHLTPFYEALFFFIGYLIANKLIFIIRRDQLKKGFNLFFFAWFFSVIYWLLDPLKESRLFFGKFNLNATLGAFLSLTLTIYFIYYFRSRFFRGIRTLINYSLNYGKKVIKKFNRFPKK